MTLYRYIHNAGDEVIDRLGRLVQVTNICAFRVPQSYLPLPIVETSQQQVFDMLRDEMCHERPLLSPMPDVL